MEDFQSKYSGGQVEQMLDQIANGELGGIVVETDPIFSASPAASITENKKKEWDNKVDKVSGKQLSTEDFTSVLKEKLEGLNNYNDTEISNAISTLRNDFDRLVSGDTTTAIKSFNEVIAFLDGIQDTQDLSSIIAAIEQQIASKQDTLVSGKNIKTINGYSILGSGNLTIAGGGEVGFSAKISLLTPQFNAVLKDSSGHYIEFTFDTTNGAGESVGESITCTYTITRGTNKTTITEKYRYNTKVRFNLDKYLQEGANDIVIKTVGDISGLSTSIGVTYQVVNLSLIVDYDISKVYDLSTKTSAIVEVPYTISGYGTKIMEWYIDGEQLEYVKVDDEVVDVSTTRTKYITISNLQQGTHSLQVRAYTSVNGELFYTDTQYFDLIVYTGVNNNLIISVAATIPNSYGVLKSGEQLKIYDAIQYETYILKFATYSPTAASSTLVDIIINNDVEGTISSSNGIENEFRYIPTSYGSMTLTLKAGDIECIIPMIVNKTSMNIDEIKNALVLDFSGEKRTNSSPNKDVWSYGNYTGAFSGFKWNNTSGWVSGRLEIDAGSSFGINYAPLAANPTVTGKTIEIEWSTKNVSNDNAVICDLRGDNGVGILITATKVSMISADGVVVETEYKSDENIRVGFVINKASGVANQRLSFIYANGIVSRSEAWAVSDNYTSNKQILFTASSEAEISLKSIRVYNTALSHDQMLNNYILYRDSISEMLEEYDANDVYEEGTLTFSPDKMMRRLPVMIVTGDIPTLENTSDKDTQIVVDVEYYNLQDPTKNFKMVGAAMRPQGTSSMGYPKKNFRIYTEKVDGTILYDHENKVVENKLYAFTENAQPVNCWCLKADYAESSGTHNTGIARLWNNALINAQIDGEYVCRTEAQKAAIAAGYQYDVRTTIDGFPILLFYRPSADDSLIFIGKYNFNNDKSTESVFGFTGIPGFNNEKMQCWEILNNGNALALFTSTEGFDTGWSEAFESRYPDTKTPYTGDLKAFCEWMSTVTAEDFKTEKWEHLNMYMIAAYWVYLMRHAAADQFVKNAMLTSEDGQHFYFILYDNDTINGLINTGRLRISPTDGRQTVDETGSYVFAGHDSRLWNLLEADDEFKNLVSEMDNALYSAGISYANTIKVFDENQADKWVARVYNQDAQYKYIGPYVEKGIDNLFMLQGKRDLHRKWWLAKRFSIFDAKYVSGTYKSQAIEVKCLNGTPSGQKFTIKAGYPIDYGYGINNIPRSFGIPLNIGDYHTFITQEVINLGDPLRIYGAPNLAEVDFSQMSDRLAVMNIASVYDDSLKTKLTKLVVGSANKTNAELEEISGLKQAVSLEYLDIQGMTKMSSLDLSNHPYFKILKAKGSGISSISFAKGAPVEVLELPSSIRVLSLNQLPYLDSDNIIFENISSLQQLNVSSCPNITNDFEFVYNWVINKTASNENCSLIMDGVVWENIDSSKFLDLCNIKTEGGTLNIKGKVSIPNATLDVIYAIKEVFGETAFYPNSELYIEVPVVLGIKSNKDSILEGENLQLTYELYPVHQGTFTYSIAQGREGCSINPTTGLLTTTEKAIDTSDVVVELSFVSTDGKIVVNTQKAIQVVRRVYPSGITIDGEGDLLKNLAFTWSYNNTGINGDFSVGWVLSGAITSYYSIDSYNQEECVLKKNTTPSDTTSGILTINIKRNFDNEIISSSSTPLSHVIVWPIGATINGSENPVENPNYTANIEGEGITGVYEGIWSLSGEITEYVQIQSQTNTSCVMRIIDAPIEFINGTLTYSLKKKYNGAIIATTTKSLRAIIEGVVITAKSNAPIQACLYEAGLVANEIYSLKSEVEKITADQLQPNNTASFTNKDSIFYDKGITHFEEFKYFTGVTSIRPATFAQQKSLTTIVLPESITSIEGYAFDDCSLLDGIIIPNNVKTIGTNAFIDCNSLSNISLPDSVVSLGKETFRNCKNLRAVKLPLSITEIPYGLFTSAESLESVEIPSSVTKIDKRAFWTCKSLKTIIFHSEVAPTLPTVGNTGDTVFGSSSTSADSSRGIYTGVNTYSTNENRLRIPLHSSGYDTGEWLDPLQNPNKCGFTIHGNFTITSNRSNAKFDVTYVTEGDVMKTINIGVGTVYINDIKYNTTITITPNTLSGGYTWDKSSVSFTYTTSANSVNFNAYIYPSSVTISGNGTIQGGNSATYIADITPSNFDVGVTYTWSLSSSSNASISPKSNQCTLTTKAVETEENLTLTCIVTTSDGRTLQNARTIKLITEPNFITATYNVTSTTSSTSLLESHYSLSNVKYMEIDGISVEPMLSYTFTTTGEHVVRYTIVNTLKRAFQGTSLTSIDFSECSTNKIDGNLETIFENCEELTSIIWSKSKFINTYSLYFAFRSCSSLTSIDLTPFTGAPITNMDQAFAYCTGLTSIDLIPLTGAPITNLRGTFKNCTSLTFIKLTPLTGAPITNISMLFEDCTSLTSIDLMPLTGAPITTISSAFSGCTSLTSIDLAPLMGAPITSLDRMFSNCTSLTSIDLTPLTGVQITSIAYLFEGCSSLKEIDLTPLINFSPKSAFMSTAYAFSGCLSLSKIVCPWENAFEVYSNTFGNNNSTYTGRNTYNKGVNKLYVPTGATGYNTGYWSSVLTTSSKCGFTLSATL